MRNLFLGLLLANLGFAAWHAWFSRKHAEDAPLEKAGAGITLVKEYGGSAVAGQPAIGSAAEPKADDKVAAVSKPVAPAGASGAAKLVGRAGTLAAAKPGVTTGTPAAATPVAPTTTSAAAKPGSDTRAAVTAPRDRCISVGPFLELGQAATASAKLRKAGYSPSQRAEEGDVRVGYWVYLDDVMPGKQADGMLAKLHANGVPDSYLIPSDSADRISLGVFTEIARADRLRDQVRALGFEPVVADRTRREDVYWIDLNLPSGTEPDFAALQTPGQINRLEQLPCSATKGA
ncbi:MAG TPA: hypothetical protein VFY39_13855 [Gammaproteobacteria bacterium]|nr:hypothetical protein [Gammaproteobacteria bacterium]